MTTATALADVPIAALPRIADLTLDDYGNDSTAATTLAAKVALVDQYAIDPAWTIRPVEELGPVWVIRWDRLTIALRDRSDLELARFIVEQRRAAAKALRVTVLDTVRAIGLPDGRYYRPANRPINAGLTRCPGCRTNVRAGGHRPGSEDCQETRRERDTSVADYGDVP